MYTYYALRAAGVRIPKKNSRFHHFNTDSANGGRVGHHVPGPPVDERPGLPVQQDPHLHGHGHVPLVLCAVRGLLREAYMKKRHSAAAASGKNVSEDTKTEKL